MRTSAQKGAMGEHLSIPKAGQDLEEERSRQRKQQCIFPEVVASLAWLRHREKSSMVRVCPGEKGVTAQPSEAGKDQSRRAL